MAYRILYNAARAAKTCSEGLEQAMKEYSPEPLTQTCRSVQESLHANEWCDGSTYSDTLSERTHQWLTERFDALELPLWHMADRLAAQKTLYVTAQTLSAIMRLLALGGVQQNQICHRTWEPFQRPASLRSDFDTRSPNRALLAMVQQTADHLSKPRPTFEELKKAVIRSTRSIILSDKKPGGALPDVALLIAMKDVHKPAPPLRCEAALPNVVGDRTLNLKKGIFGTDASPFTEVTLSAVGIDEKQSGSKDERTLSILRQQIAINLSHLALDILEATGAEAIRFPP